MIKEFCYVDTVYSLFLYLLIKNKDINETFYFFGQGIPEKIQKFFKNYYYLYKLNKRKNKIMYYIEMYKYYKNILKILQENNFFNKKIYLQDHLESSSFFLENMQECILIEDGLVNYDVNILRKINSTSSKIKYNKFFEEKIIKKINKKYKKFGLSEEIKKIYLTELASIPKEIRNKVEIINLKELWNKKTKVEKEKILDIFGFDNKIIERLKNKKEILYTQPLSEDKIITEEEKIEIYSKIIEKYKKETLVIKQHPREKTDYKKIFTNIEVLNQSFPAELFNLLGIKFEKAITLFSTAALSDKNIKIDFYGTEIHPKILKRFGNYKIQ